MRATGGCVRRGELGVEFGFGEEKGPVRSGVLCLGRVLFPWFQGSSPSDKLIIAIIDAEGEVTQSSSPSPE